MTTQPLTAPELRKMAREYDDAAAFWRKEAERTGNAEFYCTGLAVQYSDAAHALHHRADMEDMAQAVRRRA